MISKERCAYGAENKLKRTELKRRGYVSGVALSKKSLVTGYQLTKMKRLCSNSEKYNILELNISGTIKNYYKESQVKEIINQITSQSTRPATRHHFG